MTGEVQRDGPIRCQGTLSRDRCCPSAPPGSCGEGVWLADLPVAVRVALSLNHQLVGWREQGRRRRGFHDSAG